METREQIYAVFIALKDDTLLLPNAAVAEVAALENLQAAAGEPDWLLGHATWNGQRLPVVSIEAMNGAGRPEVHRRGRLVVVNALSRDIDGRHWGFLSQGYPHLVTLNRAAMQRRPAREHDRPELTLCRLKIANHDALLPDLEAVEGEMLRAGVLQQSAAAA